VFGLLILNNEVSFRGKNVSNDLGHSPPDELETNLAAPMPSSMELSKAEDDPDSLFARHVIFFSFGGDLEFSFFARDSYLQEKVPYLSHARTRDVDLKIFRQGGKLSGGSSRGSIRAVSSMIEVTDTASC
jgi:hypothetical protein